MFAKTLIRMLAFVGAAILVWSVAARPSVAHGRKQTVRVHAYDTLWTIAEAHYSGDLRDAVWRIQRANHLAGATVRPGQTLVLP